MLKFIKHHMESITGIEIYPLISLLIFFIFFSGLIYWALRTNKALFSEMQYLPLDGKRQVLVAKAGPGNTLSKLSKRNHLKKLHVLSRVKSQSKSEGESESESESENSGAIKGAGIGAGNGA